MGEWVKSPYVAQVDKFVTSLDKLSKVFLRLEKREEYYTQDETDNMYERVIEKVCGKCKKYDDCKEKGDFAIRQMLHEIFCVTEEFGAELNIELKRKIQSKCIQAPRFLREALETLREAKKDRVWNEKIVQNREGCAIQLDTFAQMVQHATRELEASIFSDEHLEKKLKRTFSKNGVKLLSSVFFVTREGKLEVHVTAKVVKGDCIATKEICRYISDCVGRNMELAHDERQVLGMEYSTIICVESVRYFTLQGIAKISKGCETISGDNFSMLQMQDGKQCMILSDGMGSGEPAYKESLLVVELLEELLEAGFPKETAIQMLNTALALGREEVRFSTVDMCVFDLYAGACEFVKAGASVSFIKKKEGVEVIKSESLPIGVVPKVEIDNTIVDLEPGDLVIMVTDGVMDALPSGQQEIIMKKIIEGTKKTNLKEFAHHILEQVLACLGELPLDDMTILIAGIWSLEKSA